MSVLERLSSDWVSWLAKNLLEDEPTEALIRVLMDEGLCRPDATAALDELQQSPLFHALRLAHRPRALTQRLRVEHLRLAPREVPRRPDLSPDQVMTQHIAPQEPVILPDKTDDWPASGWTWETLAAEYGHLEVNACQGRASVEKPDQHWQDLVTPLSFRELIEHITDPTTGNDLYLTANMQALHGPLAPLQDGFPGLPGLIPKARIAEEAEVWIGGAGTLTPLHHDTSDILLCPFLGSKRVWLIPPEEIEVTAQAEKFWAPPIDLSRTDLAIREAEVGAGEILLIPSGWWHRVEGIEPSITVTFAGLGHRNCYKWFMPGFPESH